MGRGSDGGNLGGAVAIMSDFAEACSKRGDRFYHPCARATMKFRNCWELSNSELFQLKRFGCFPPNDWAIKMFFLHEGRKN